MALTMDDIVSKTFTIVSEGYDKDQVDGFLDEILDEMEAREKETEALKAQIATLKAQPAAAAAPAPVQASTESFELVLTKARAAYDEIVAAAEQRSASIVAAAEQEAASMRTKAQAELGDLNASLTAAKAQTAGYYSKLSSAMKDQNELLKKLQELM